jgi:hypothetical protein
VEANLYLGSDRLDLGWSRAVETAGPPGCDLQDQGSLEQAGARPYALDLRGVGTSRPHREEVGVDEDGAGSREPGAGSVATAPETGWAKVGEEVTHVECRISEAGAVEVSNNRLSAIAKDQLVGLECAMDRPSALGGGSA